MEKILVLQLARLGDVYQTWPVLRALRRAHTGSEIHLLTRKKFAAAAPHVQIVDRQWQLDTKDVLTPLVDEVPDLDQSLDRLMTFVGEIKAQGFDRIINLSFSPFSSYLASELSQKNTRVSGYTRFSDGTLQIPDDGSAYFYAQTGPNRSNRVHVTDLFANVAEIELTEMDWLWSPPHGPEETIEVREAGEGSIVVHVGASDLEKTLSWSKWQQIVKGLLESRTENVVLIGSNEEASLASQISAPASVKNPGRKVINLVGRTDLQQLFTIIANAKVLIGGDSAPVQIASLTNTPVLNMSLALVSLWETGPRSTGSRIVRVQDEALISAEEIVREACALLDHRPGYLDCVHVSGRTTPYTEVRSTGDSFSWQLLQAIYMNAEFPNAPNQVFLAGLKQLAEVNALALEQIAYLQRSLKNQTAVSILEQVDQVMEKIETLVPQTAPLIRWFMVERLRIGPMTVEEMTKKTLETHLRLQEVLDLYVQTSGLESIQNVEGGV